MCNIVFVTGNIVSVTNTILFVTGKIPHVTNSILFITDIMGPLRMIGPGVGEMSPLVT